MDMYAPYACFEFPTLLFYDYLLKSTIQNSGRNSGVGRDTGIGVLKPVLLSNKKNDYEWNRWTSLYS